MSFPANKTKIVCTIGPASDSPGVLERMMVAGMNVVRLNFSHGDFDSHRDTIQKVRTAAQITGRRVAIMADLPGPKMRIGEFAEEPIELKPDDTFTLTTEDIEDDVQCSVIVGGELRSRKGLNLPGIDLGISAFTDRDHECLKFALENGVDAVSQSFVEAAEDVAAVREAAKKLGHDPFIIAKIERAGARNHIHEILKTSDGIMIARGDLGVEIPIEQIAVAQKNIMRQANLLGKPVITATQMLESMTGNRRPTRAEATDVANAILDGTDCVMLSGESAMGEYPVQSVNMLARIAAAIEPHRTTQSIDKIIQLLREKDEKKIEDLISLSVETTLQQITPSSVIVPTRSGATARSITRFRLPVWITAVSSQQKTCQDLMFSYGVCPVCEPQHPKNWRKWTRDWLKSHNIAGNLAVLTEGPSEARPDRNNRMEIIDLTRD
jgi:pyruvate kinase